MLEALSLSCGYRNAPVFEQVSLSIRPGELLALLGPNGSGKTTLLRALARLLRPRAGKVQLDGQDVWTRPPGEVARTLAFVPQGLAADWPFTVREFVALGRAPHRGWWLALTAHDHARTDAALDQLGLTSLRDRLITELSGGEWQRVRLARALAAEPRVLLLDEPTAHLDPLHQQELLAAVRGLSRSRGLAVLMVLHDLNLVGPWADRVALLARGRLQAVGTPAEVLTAPTLAAAYGLWLAVAPHPLTAAPAIAITPEMHPP